MDTQLITSISKALKYLEAQGAEIPVDIQLKARQYGVTKAAGDLASVNSVYHDAITKALIAYFEGGSLASSRNAFKKAVAVAFLDAFELGWTDGGGTIPIDADAMDWLAAQQESEFGHIDELFQQAKTLKKEPDFDFFAWATERADGYTNTTQAIYNAGMMWANKSMMGTWKLGNTERHCSTCSSLDGKRHKLSWYISRNYIPRKPGAAMKCGGYWCDCGIYNDNGDQLL